MILLFDCSNFDFLCSLHFLGFFFLIPSPRFFVSISVSFLAHFYGVVRPGSEASRERNWRFFFFFRFLCLVSGANMYC